MSTQSEPGLVRAYDEADWRRLAEAALAGAPLSSLESRTEDGVAYGPLHPRHIPARPLRRHAAPWTILQRVDDPDPARAGGQVAADLGGGAEGLSLVFAGATSANGFGLGSAADAAEALAAAVLDAIAFRIEPHADASLAPELLRRLAAARGLPVSALDLDLGFDPVGTRAFSGSLSADDDDLHDETTVAATLAADGFRGRLFEADGRPYHAAGAGPGQELAAVLATAVRYLRSLDDAGLGVAAERIGFTLAADQQQFPVIAKFRALRLVWRRVLELCGAGPTPARLHAETSLPMMAARDPHTNILRTTIAAFAAVAGGADSLVVHPFTAAIGLPEAKARRLARNTQVILREETGLARVADPGAGAGGIEALTQRLAAAAWAEFRRIEGEGGIARSLSTGALPARIAAVSAETLRARDAGERPQIGVTLYPPPAGQPLPDVLLTRPQADGAAA